MLPEPNSFAERVLSATTPEEIEALQRELEAAEKSEGVGSGQSAVGGEPWIVAKLSDVAEWFGVELQTVKQWRTEAEPMPGTAGLHGKPGRYDLREITRWRIRKAERGAANQSVGIDRDLKRKKDELEIASLELEVEKKRGGLVRRDAVLAEAASMAARLAGWLDQLPDELAAVEPDATARARLIDAIRGKVKAVRLEVVKWSEGPTGEASGAVGSGQ